MVEADSTFTLGHVRVSLLGVSVGLLVMLVGFFAVPPPQGRFLVMARLTEMGLQIYQPERDMMVYVVGCLLGIALPAVLVVLLAAGRFLLKAYRLRTMRGEGSRETLHMGDRLSGQQHVVRPSTVLLGTPFSVLWDGAWLTMMGLLVVALLAIPDISLLSGNMYSIDGCHHWEYFALGPALQVRAGRALGSAAYTQYGVAFPLFLAGIDPIVPLRFDNLLRWSIGFGCVYFTGLALLLRVLLRSRLWAAIGTLVAVNLQCFTGTASFAIWFYPSSSILRYGLDIWFFLALCLHVRTRNQAWLAICGVVNGLAILWEMDTGIYLLGVSVLYSIAVAVQPRCALSEETPARALGLRPSCSSGRRPSSSSAAGPLPTEG